MNISYASPYKYSDSIVASWYLPRSSSIRQTDQKHFELRRTKWWKMISGTPSSFPNGPQGLHMYGVPEDVVSSSLEAISAGSDTHSNSLLYNLSVLKERVHQVQSLACIFISPDKSEPVESKAIAVASMTTSIQEIVATASSMMFTCQQIVLGGSNSGNSTNNDLQLQQQHQHVKFPNSSLSHVGDQERALQGFYSSDHHMLNWYGNNQNNTDDNNNWPGITVSNEIEMKELPHKRENSEGLQGLSPSNNDIIELDAADILAKYTHYCQVCGKGFKRDANLRMHMRAHGDEYKSSAALSNPMKKKNINGNGNKEHPTKKYSCPHEGCRWNRKHAKFQPLKSMICVKNHYKRSHCPKMYVCKRCNRKQFSVLSDLRTHEKHCGDIKWQCSCGTTFSRKDKLMGHVALFVGHIPAIN